MTHRLERRGALSGLALSCLAGVVPCAVFAQTPPPAAERRKAIDTLLSALKAAPDEAAAAALEGKLRALWLDEASPALKLLLLRGRREMAEGAPGDARESYQSALDLEPDLLEAWRGRATARLHLGDVKGAVHDLEEMLRREPRDFAAWQDLAGIAESRGDWKGALAAWQKLLEVDPQTPGAQDRLHDLRRRALGESA